MKLRLPLILASASPRRKMLLESEGLSLQVLGSGVEERHIPGESPRAYALRNARLKAEDVAGRLKTPGIVLGADTIVVCGEHILEKPRDRADAVKMLTQLSGRTHQVMTGVALASCPAVHDEVWVSVTDVTFRPLTSREIEAYVDTGEPMDKAGAYAIQGGAAGMVQDRQGSYSNVVGLPVEEVLERLRSLGLVEK